jgi:hypothetical protein
VYTDVVAPDHHDVWLVLREARRSNQRTRH